MRMSTSLLVLMGTFMMTKASLDDVDGNGYIVYCPCMGRFGNQMDHMLGSLAFAKSVNRTLLIPPFIEYSKGKTVFTPYETYFSLPSLSLYHRVISLEDFMSKLADTVWPKESRAVLCHSARRGKREKSCNADDGNPFGAFWANFNISFVKNTFYSSIDDLVLDPRFAAMWNEKYGHVKVWAFVGAPAPFPVRRENNFIQRYIEWNDKFVDKANKFVEENFNNKSFIALHLRNGGDWVRACELVPSVPTLFSSPQCMTNVRSLTSEMCLPSKSTVLTTVLETLRGTGLSSIFVASDDDHMIDELYLFLKRNDIPEITIVKTDNDAHLDLVLLEMSKHFIGNCVSSFSAFVVRARRERERECSFWGLENHNEDAKEEL